MDLDDVDLINETISTDRLLLRPYRSDDVDPAYRACQDVEMQRWLTALPSPYTRAAAVEFITEIAPRGREAGTDLGCAIEAAGELVGSCGAHHLTTGRLGPEIGYWIAPWARRQGYAAEAARALSDWASGTARRGCTCSPTSATPPRRPSRCGRGSPPRGRFGPAWSTGTVRGAMR